MTEGDRDVFAYAPGLVRLIRRRLSETDARDVANEFGQLVEQGLLYDRLPGDSLDARLSALVERAQRLSRLQDLLDVCLRWRPDLKEDVALLTQPAQLLEAHLPHNLPPQRGQFLGREHDVDRVLEGLSKQYRLVTVEGPPGVGKTSLAVRVGHAVLAEQQPTPGPVFDYVVWVSAMDKPDQKRWLNEVINTVAAVMNRPVITQMPLDHLDQKRNELERHLRFHRVLVIIDNFESIEDPALVAWMEHFPAPGHILVTTRGTWQRQSWAIPIVGLEEPTALALIRQEARASALDFLETVSDESLLPLVRVTAGNPRLIEMALGNILAGYLDLEELVQQLGEAGADVEEVFDYLYSKSWEILTDDARAVLMTVPLFVGTMAREALRTASGLSTTEFGKAVRQLVANWLFDRPTGNGRFSVHPMTRAFARKHLSADPDFERLARERWSNYYVDFVRKNTQRDTPAPPYWNSLVSDKMNAINDEWLSILEVMNWAGRISHETLLLELVMRLVHYMDSRFFNLERLEFVRVAVRIAESLGRREVEALLRVDALGWTYVEENRLEEAEAEISTGLAVAELLDDGDYASDLRALGLAWLARLEIERGRSEAARDLLQKALATACSPWINYRVHMAAGDIWLKQNDGSRALAMYEKAVDEYERYGGEGSGYQIEPRIGLALLAGNDLEAAEEKFRALFAQDQIAIGKLYGAYGIAVLLRRKGSEAEARAIADSARKQLTQRTTSNLLLQMIDAHFEDHEAGPSVITLPDDRA